MSKAVPFSAADLANITKANPYIQRLLDDATLRDNVRTAIDSSKSAYDRISNGKAPAKAVLQDKKLQRDLHEAYDAAREAFEGLQDAPKSSRKKKKLGFGRKLLLLGVGAGLALAGLGEAALQGARHAVRRRGGVPVHAAGRHRRPDHPGGSRHCRLTLGPIDSRSKAPCGAPSTVTARTCV